MSYAYPRSSGASFLPSSTTNLSSGPVSFVKLALDWLHGGAQRLSADGTANLASMNSIRSSASFVFRRIFTVANAVILLWVFTLRWGERTVFQESINACVWKSWERWVSQWLESSIYMNPPLVSLARSDNCL